MKIRGQEVHTSGERLRKLSESKPSGCIEWTSTTRNGYGSLIIGSRIDGTRRTVRAHRLAYELEFGPIPDGLWVCHKCDNPKCINPAHLFVGTRQDNIDDREAKGRNNHVRKLTDDDVRMIHSLKGIKTSRQIAGMLGVCRDTVKDIWRGRRYPELKPLPPSSPA